MKTVKLEETPNRRRLHIGSFFFDLNESDYQELQNIFSTQLKEQLAAKDLRVKEVEDINFKICEDRDFYNREFKRVISELAAKEKECEVLKRNLSVFDYDLPENMPLYKDSGLWQLRSDCMNEVFLQQRVHESYIDFIDRCKQYNREEILKP